jgi:hypothetical protein
MTMENLPRPWLLAALTGMSMTEIVRTEEDEQLDRSPRRPLPCPERRRPRLRGAERLRRFDDSATRT